MPEDIIFSLIYLAVSISIIYPPTEFVTAGFTIPVIFSHFLGHEHDSFVMYHIRRVVLTLLVYSLLPLGYVASVYLWGYSETSNLFFWKPFVTVSIILPITAIAVIAKWTSNKFENHPIAENLRKFSSNDNWRSLASNIDMEFRRIDKVVIPTNPTTKIVVTENWILKVCPLTVHIIHQSTATLSVMSADTVIASDEELSETQFLNIEVKSSRQDVNSFIIRVNSRHFRDLEDRIARNITVLPNIKFHKSVIDKFVDVFKATIAENPKYSTNEDMDPCIGCLQAMPNVKIQRLCDDKPGDSNKCTSCNCRPMWCVECMAKWFASRQDPNQKETWLNSKCTCPMCRATFCLLDISYLSLADAENNG